MTTTDLRRFSVESFKEKPVARISPEEATAILGSRVIISAAGSTLGDSYDGMLFFWRLSAKPVDSTARLALADGADKAVTLEADVTGTYEITLYAEAEGVRSDEVTSAVFFSPAVVPAARRLAVDGSFMFNVLSDFWTLVNGREVFPVVWSGMTQAVASDFLRAVQVDRAKSIATIQPLFQTRWMAYNPWIDLEPSTLNTIFGGMQSGEGAFTGSVTFVGKATVISRRELLLDGPTTVRAIGTTLQLFSGPSRGSYIINRLNADGSGYVVSESSPLAGPDERLSGTTLVCPVRDLTEVYDISADFSDVQVGECLHILAGPNSGYHTVAEVVDSTHVRLTESLFRPLSNMRYRVLRTARASFRSPQQAFTDTVYIPENEASLEEFVTSGISGSGQVVNSYEIYIEDRHVIDSIEGARLRILSGTRAGTLLEIASLNQSRTGVVVASSIPGTIYPETISYAVELPVSVSSRVIVLDGVGHSISSFELLTGMASEEEGGTGNVWAVTLQSPTAPSGRIGIRWRICPTVEVENTDLEALGISTGDTVELRVERTDLQISTTIYAQVLGVSGSRFAFDLGTTEIPFGKNESGVFYSGTVDTADLLRAARELSIPSVDESASGQAVFTGAAFEIYEILHGSDFSERHRNTPIDPETLIYLPSFFSIRVIPTGIIRNSRIPIDVGDEVTYSIPALFEYISTETVERAEDGATTLVHVDGSSSTLTRPPVKMSENNDFVLSSTELRGTALSTRAGVSAVTVSDRSLISWGIRPGDELELLTGLSQGSFAITAVVSESTLRISGRISDGSFPVATENSIEFVIRRRAVGRFIEYAIRFGPSDPAPRTLWAPLTLLDNTQYIEDNFGLLVGVTKSDLDRYGVTQLSYRSAVAGLMFAWASGPTIRSAEIGAHIVLDLPVTEKPCEILTIDPTFSATFGRVITEELDSDGLGTGIVNIYRYPRSDLYSLEKFKGLGINPLTGATFVEGDFIAPFTPLTNAVIVSDQTIFPNWWREYSAVPGAVELQKYHTWQVEIDVQAVDSRDLPLAAEFLSKIRPIYTKPIVVAVLALLDSVQAQDDLLLHMDGFFFDDPGFSRESSSIFDDNNGSTLALRRVDAGSRMTRTLFEGSDLVFVTGSDSVTSARGGFTGEAQLDSINSYFGESTYPDGVSVTGLNLVRAGDHLVVLSGKNSGSFLITAVSANTLTIAQDVDGYPRGIPLDMVRSESGVRFQITRDSSYIITEGTDFTVGDAPSIEGISHTRHVLLDENASFRSDGVTAGDRLIVLSGDNRGVYVIEDLGVFNNVAVGTNTGTPDFFLGQEIALTLSQALPSAESSASYRIERWALQENPIFTGAGVGSSGAESVEISDADLKNIEFGDRLEDTVNHRSYRVIAVSGNSVFIQGTLGAAVTQVEIHKNVLDDVDGDSDARLERLMGYDTIELDIYCPISAVSGTSGTISVTGITATLSGGTALAGDLLILNPSVVETDPVEGSISSSSHGVYRILSVDGLTVSVDGEFPVAENLLGEVWRNDSTAFTLTDSTRVDTLVDVSSYGVQPGDFFEYSSGTTPIIEVAADHFIVADVLPGTSSVSGRIFRRRTPDQGTIHADD